MKMKVISMIFTNFASVRSLFFSFFLESWSNWKQFVETRTWKMVKVNKVFEKMEGVSFHSTIHFRGRLHIFFGGTFATTGTLSTTQHQIYCGRSFLPSPSFHSPPTPCPSNFPLPLSSFRFLPSSCLIYDSSQSHWWWNLLPFFFHLPFLPSGPPCSFLFEKKKLN